MTNPLIQPDEYFDTTNQSGGGGVGYAGRYGATAPYLALLILGSVVFLTLLQLSGFKAMIAIGRGG